MKAILVTSLIALSTSTAHAFDLTNGSFETGDFTGWTVIDSPMPFIPMQVSSGFGSPGFGFFTHEVTDGNFGMVMGFESLAAPVVMSISQVATINAQRPNLKFTYRAAWDMFNFAGSTLPREGYLRVRTLGSSTVVYEQRFLRANAQTLRTDTGDRDRDYDLSAFAGQTLEVALEWEIPEPSTGPGFLQIDEIRFEGQPIGTNYCTAVANSTGVPAEFSASGTNTVAQNNLVLECSDVPGNSFSFFLTSMTQGVSMNPGGSQGTLCLSGAIGRYVGAGQIQNSGPAGVVSLAVDLAQHPTPTGLIGVQAGETWNFQCWYRDAVGGSATSNFSDGFEMLFN